MTFLRFTVKLSYSQIALVVEKSKTSVYRFIKGLENSEPQLYPNVDNRNKENKKKMADAFKRNLPWYKKRFQEWVDGKYETVE